ncbi:MAG: efflux RND transporter periplasmic adaptor subunit [Lentisphaeria bacterium]|nr:efflux RND transporter periplasmic adaptor subunit [Lentisphaeria bacterium]
MNHIQDKIAKGAKLAALMVLCLLAGRLWQKSSQAYTQAPEHMAHNDRAASQKAQVWTCSMHPQIMLPKPGKCPICFMDLIPQSNEHEHGPRQLSISDHAAKLMQLETVEIGRSFAQAEVRMRGKIDYDETTVTHISAWTAGRLDRLYVNYTGIPVQKGEHLAELYSPELISAQEELLQALKMQRELQQSDSEIMRDSAKRTLLAAREKLRLLGLTPEQTEALEQSGKPGELVTIYATSQGVVIEKKAQEGMYVQTGSRIYTIADLSRIWVKLDVYESELAWVKIGSEVEFSTEAYPGRSYRGKVSFIDPVINPKTRSAKLRLSVQNQDLSLKPGMFVRATLRATVAENGKILNPDLKGKWISPMHPEIVKDEPGSCEVCGMPLRSAESLGYVNDEEAIPPLLIPRAAALKTGRRAVAYVQLPDQKTPLYEGREITLGPRLGDFYIVEKGLQEGERVVSRAAFKLDAEMQIQAKPSMMSEHETHSAKAHTEAEQPSAKFALPHEFDQQLKEVLLTYLEIQEALADDQPEKVKLAGEKFADKLGKIDSELLEEKARQAWLPQLRGLNAAKTALLGLSSLDKQREAFQLLSSQLMQTLKQFRPEQLKLYKASCPMAFDNVGAAWIQKDEKIANPYFGHMMLRCGDIEHEL